MAKVEAHDIIACILLFCCLVNAGVCCRWCPLMAEGCIPVAREWQGAIGLQDSMVIVAGRLDIPEFEPIPISSDTMCANVEILWHRPPGNKKAPTGELALAKYGNREPV